MKTSSTLLALALALAGCDKKQEASTSSKAEAPKEDKAKTKASLEQCQAAVKHKIELYEKAHPGVPAYAGGLDGETGRGVVSNCHEGKQWSVAAVECITESKTEDEEYKCLKRFPPLRDTGGAPAPKAPGAP
ncbi:MAG: hypothetical protein IPM79_33740 [Polyangiaceae bacterium]|nr:hypothetical protein [Polyangiaceae bacterium]